MLESASELLSNHIGLQTQLPIFQGSPSEQGSQEAKGIGEEKVEEQPEASTSLPKCFLVIHSVSKRHNVGNLLRSATAFGVAEVCLADSHHSLSPPPLPPLSPAQSAYMRTTVPRLALNARLLSR